MSETRALPTPPAVEADRVPAAWRVVGTSVAGVSHERSGLPCQDAQDWCVLDDGTLLVALADGAGSARFSEDGARLAVEAALRWLSEALSGDSPPPAAEPGDSPGGEAENDPHAGWKALILGAFLCARAEVLLVAEEAGDAPREYAATLTCVIADGSRLVVAQLGDGAVVADSGDGLYAATRLQRGEYANETHFLIEEDALDQVVVDIYDRPADLLAVMSDGLIRLALKMPAQEPHAPFFEPLFRFARQAGDPDAAAAQLAGFLSSERVNARTDDDKTLVLAVRVEPGPDRGKA